jgi:hypothetical protein
MDIHVHLSATAIRWLYMTVVMADLLFILMTAAAGLDVSIIPDALLLQCDLRREGVLGAWYSSVLLLLNSMACMFVMYRRQERSWRGTWLVVALGLLMLSADETAELHERLGVKIDHLGFGAGYVPSKAPVFNWLMPAIPVAAVFGWALVVASRFWAETHPRSRRLALAGLACWGGVLVAEFAESQMVRHGMRRSLQAMTEEGLELVGSTLFLIAFLEYLRASARVSPEIVSGADEGT